MSTHEVYCSLDICKLLREAGFDWECDAIYGKVGENFNFYQNVPKLTNTNNDEYSAPTLAVAQRWLREEKLYDVLVDTGGYKNYEYFINYHGVKEGPNYPFHEYNHNLICNTYEEALEAGIKKVLEIILEKGE